MGRGRNKSAKKWRAKVARVAKSVTLRTAETKRYIINGENTSAFGAGAIIPLFSNGGSSSLSSGPFVDFPLRFIDQGDGITQRAGNRIVLKGLHAHFQVEQDPTILGHTHVRIAMLWIDPNQVLSALTFGNWFIGSLLGTNPNTTTSAFFRTGTDNDGIINKVIYDRVFALTTGNAPTTSPDNVNQVGQKLIKVHIPFHNKMYQFINGTTGSQGEHEDLVMLMTAYTPGRDGTQQVANVRCFRKVYYKDP